jgi:hypothetical protein
MKYLSKLKSYSNNKTYRLSRLNFIAILTQKQIHRELKRMRGKVLLQESFENRILKT